MNVPTEENKQQFLAKQIEAIRTRNYGYVGGKVFTTYATDEEIIEMVLLKDKEARLYNSVVRGRIQ